MKNYIVEKHGISRNKLQSVIRRADRNRNGKAPDLQGWRYEIIKNAGVDLEKSILLMMNEMATNNVVAQEWEEMIIKAINKPKGDTREMDS